MRQKKGHARAEEENWGKRGGSGKGRHHILSNRLQDFLMDDVARFKKGFNWRGPLFKEWGGGERGGRRAVWEGVLIYRQLGGGRNAKKRPCAKEGSAGHLRRKKFKSANTHGEGRKKGHGERGSSPN